MPNFLSRSAALTLVVAAVALFPVRPAGASGPAQGAGDAATGMNNWHTLAPGGSAEWVFRYPGGNDPALIAFGADPASSITVNVYDDDQWRALGAGDRSIEPVGRGTQGTLYPWSANQDLIANGSLFWEAVAGPATRFHIQVSNASQGPARYWIAQAGAGAGELTLVSPVAAASPTPQPHAAAPAQAARTQPRQPAAGAPIPSGAQPLPPPQTLPVTGSAWLIPALAAGLLLVAVGRRLRPG